MGGLTMIYADGRTSKLPGCRFSDTAGYKGTWYAFERWLDGGTRTRIARVSCEKCCYGSDATQGAPSFVWDGNQLADSP
jgi:hypothetical protein